MGKSEFPEIHVFSSGELQSLYPRFQRTFVNKFIGLKLIILRESIIGITGIPITGIILKHSKLLVDKNYLLNQGS